MKRSYIILIVILSITSNAFSQNIDYEDEFADSLVLNPIIELPKKYQYNIELHLLGIGLSIERRLSNRASLGIGTAFQELELFVYKPSFYPKLPVSQLGAHIFYSYYHLKRLKYEFGLRYAVIVTTGHKGCDGPCYKDNFLMYFNVLYGFKHVKIGTRLSIAQLKTTSDNNSHTVVLSKPIFLRITF
jgi:hypothetical protein